MNCSKLILAALSLVASPVVAQDRIDFAGSSTVQPVMEDMHSVFSSKGLKTRVQGGGSGVGVKATLSGMAKVGMASRELTGDEAKSLKVFPFAKDAVAIIVNQANPVTELTSDEVRSIYTGSATTWKTGKAITLINKEPGRATLEVFEDFFKIKGQIRKDAVVIGPNGQAVMTVANDPNGIAYVSMGDAIEAEKQGVGIRIVKLDGVLPSPKTVLDGTYKLFRNLNLVYKPEFETGFSVIRSAVLSDEGRKIIESHNFLPITK